MAKSIPLVAGMLILLAVAGTTYYLTNIDQTYYCEDKNVVSMCFKLSSISNGISTRCYYNENMSSKYFTCSSGWKPIKHFPDIMNNLTITGNDITSYEKVIKEYKEELDENGKMQSMPVYEKYDKFIVEDMSGVSILTAELNNYKEDCINGTICQAIIDTNGKNIKVESINFNTWDNKGSPERKKVKYNGDIDTNIEYQENKIILNANKPSNLDLDWVITLTDGIRSWEIDGWAWWNGIFTNLNITTTLLSPENDSEFIFSNNTFLASVSLTNTSYAIQNSTLYIWNKSAYDMYWNTTGLVAWYQFDDNSANDYFGVNNGTNTNGAYQSAVGKIGGSAVFDGANDRITSTIQSTLSYPNEFTVSLWFNPTLETFQVLLANFVNTTDRFTLFYDINGVHGQIYSGSYPSAFNRQTSTVFTTGVWANVIYVKNTTGSKIYYNGIISDNAGSTTVSAGTISGFSIGSSTNGLRNFSGSIDEVRIYNRSLSESEIANLYAIESIQYNSTGTGSATNQNFSFSVSNLTDGQKYWNVWGYDTTNVFGAWQSTANELTISSHKSIDFTSPTDTTGSNLSRNYIKTNLTYNFTNFGGAGITPMDTNGLVAYYPMDYNANDYFGLNNGTEQNGVAKGVGYAGGGYVFDGVNDYVNISFNQYPNYSNGFTFSIWAKTQGSTYSEESYWFLQNNQTGYPSLIALLIRNVSSPTEFMARFRIITNTSCDISAVSTSTNLNNNEWRHITGVMNNTNMLIYIDGNYESIATVPSKCYEYLPRLNPSATRFSSIGSNLGTSPINGSIDDVRIYNRSLSESEIMNLYQMTKPITTTPNYTELTNLSDGQKSFRAVACDNVNNVCNYTEIRQVLINTCLPPEINTNWITRFDYNCKIYNYTDIGTGNLTLTGGPGNFTLYAGLKLKSKSQTCNTAPCNFILNPMLEFI
jgi:hypothetical protein